MGHNKGRRKRELESKLCEYFNLLCIKPDSVSEFKCFSCPKFEAWERIMDEEDRREDEEIELMSVARIRRVVFFD